jgi:hypothetical protein
MSNIAIAAEARRWAKEMMATPAAAL